MLVVRDCIESFGETDLEWCLMSASLMGKGITGKDG